MKTKLALLMAALIFATCEASAAENLAPVTSVAQTKRLGVEEFDKLRASTNVVVLDVRSLAEFEKGRIPGATNIDIASLRFAERVNALDKNKIYVVNCAVGVRSARACKKMENMGFKELYDLAPGFDGWKKAGRPVEK